MLCHVCLIKEMPGLLGPLGSILAASLLAVRHTGAIQNATNYVIPNAGEVSDATAADENRTMLLKIVVDAGDIGSHLLAVGEPDPRDLTESGVGFLGRHRSDDQAYTPPLGAAADVRNPVFALPLFARASD
jgi:hypothetical protein